MLAVIEPPFGAYALPAWLEGLRRFGLCAGRSGLARRICSVIRRICIAGRPDPFDVEPFPGQKARLYPRDNLSEKRVFSASQFWDHEEREVLAQAAAASASPFMFVDAGANVGLYTLAVLSTGPVRGLAVEPDPENLRRLRFNLAASGGDTISVAGCALSDRDEEVFLAASDTNRGEISLQATAADQTAVKVRAKPLIDVVREAGLDRIDALKMDIEGMEAPVLEAFFNAAPAPLMPGLIILEARRGEETRALEVARQNGYIASRRTKLNVILTRPDDKKDPQHGKA
ncbi:MAG: FkbM family methyltransferase [Pseudomonadota bacterium]